MNSVNDALREYLLAADIKEEVAEEKPKFGMKFFNIERKLDKIIAMLDYIMWKENRNSYEENIRNI